LREEAEGLESAVGKRVEDADLDVGVVVEDGEDRVEPADAVVVEEHPKPHAALGRIPQLLEHKEPRRVRCQM
jgi:hypothetical protein